MGFEPKSLVSIRLTLLAGCVLLGARAEAQHYKQTSLVSDQAGAAVLDGSLVNPWGLSRSSGSPWWAADNGAGVATLYNGTTGAKQGLVVTVPPFPGSSDPGVPTGTLFNGTTEFELTAGNPARFLFATEDGTISGWNPAVDPTHAVVMVKNKTAVYKGLAIASRGTSHLLYVTNFAKGRVEAYDSAFKRVHLGDGDHDGDDDRFQDERLPHGFAPFGVQNIGGELFVTFAKRDPATNDDVKGAGLGYVDVFSPSGRLLRRLEHGPWLNAPWAVALAPGDFGAFSHNLLVGQFGSGEIAAYDIVTGKFIGKMLDSVSGGTLVIDGLWALSFGNGANAGPLNSLFFTAGIEDESHGLFGNLTPLGTEQLLGNGQ